MKNILFIIPLLLFSCTEVIDIEMPAHESQLVVEGYLQPGKLFTCAVFETVNYFDETNVPVMNDVSVILSSPLFTDTLYYLALTPEIGYYQGHHIIPWNYDVTWNIDVRDGLGRHASGQSKIATPVPIDSISFFEKTSITYTLMLYYNDPANQSDSYCYWSRNVRDMEPNESFQLTDQFFDGMYNAMPTTREHTAGDTLEVRLLHVNDDYYEFLQTLDQANSIGWDVVQEPLNVRSNITGGIGIFTGFDALSYTVVVPN